MSIFETINPRKMKKLLWFIVLEGVTLGSLLAQTLEGTVQSFAGPIPEATVQEFSPSGNNTTTNEKGEFKLVRSDTSIDRLIASASGYRSDTILIGHRKSVTITLSNQQSSYVIKVYEVFGMGCPRCHKGLENQVNQLDGVNNSQANWYENSLILQLKKGQAPTEQEVLAAIKRANLDAGRQLQ